MQQTKTYKTYIDICHKESESCAAYTEHITAHLNNVANITINGDGINPQKKKNRREKDIRGYRKIYLDKNGENKSIIESKTIEPNARNKIERS